MPIFSFGKIGRTRNYRHIFFDLDRTLWDFELNREDALRDLFFEFQLDTIFPNFTIFLKTFNRHNEELWRHYTRNEITKEVVRYKRFDSTLSDYGTNNTRLAKKLGEEYLNIMPLKTALIPGSRELLEYLAPNYTLHILSNGFKEVQLPKLKRCHLEHYFSRIITTDSSGYHKPDQRAFGHALSKANAKKTESLMVGDDLEVDIIGAKRFGIGQVYFNPTKTPHKQRVTHEISYLLEIRNIL